MLSKVAEIAHRHGTEPKLIWTNGRGGTTFEIGNHFVKWNPHSTGLCLEKERARLEWAIRYHTVPKVVEWGSNDEGQWLVTRALAGESAVSKTWLARPREAARAIGRGFRILHERLPVADCPFDWSIQTRTGGRVSPEEWRVPPTDLVVCHGDPCAPNTIIGPDGNPTGHVDLGCLGVADRWADLGVASVNLELNYGPGLEAEFFKAYEIKPDPERIAYYRFLWDHEETLGDGAEALIQLRELGNKLRLRA